ncbi:MAG: acyltransferase [Clostridia bacterium]|nr:acyltransferase [Clostridia bacterium]
MENTNSQFIKNTKENTVTERNSNLELYRIIVMILIVAHHYIVNSGLLKVMNQNPLLGKSIFLYLFGAWGKTGINCFVLITGYFMCTKHITSKKFFKLFFEVEFYNIIFYAIFLCTGYARFSITDLVNAIIPFYSVDKNFSGCFLIFYLFIPFLNVIINNITKTQHILLICLILFVFVIIDTLPKSSITFNYVSWFICLYCISSYVRLYPNKIFDKTKMWGLISLLLFILSCLSIILFLYYGVKINNNVYYYYLVSDSNRPLAVCLAFASFLFFKNIKMQNSKFINTVSVSTFGVLLIHANSDTMRRWLWVDTLKNVEMFSTNYIVVHALVSVLAVFIICSFIDIIRSKTIEKPFINYIDSKYNKLLLKFKK